MFVAAMVMAESDSFDGSGTRSVFRGFRFVWTVVIRLGVWYMLSIHYIYFVKIRA